MGVYWPQPAYMTARFVCLLLPALIPAAAQEVEFNRDIRPILSDKCFTCHGPDAGNRKNKVRFDIESGAKIELSGGRVSIVPGNAAGSEVYRRISADNQAIRMPPAYAGKEKLTGHEIGVRNVMGGGQESGRVDFGIGPE